MKRVYDPPGPGDGFRVLVDRLWPRGMKKEELQADLWLKEVAPSTELRQWFHHQPENWEEFSQRYLAELDRQPEAVERLLQAVQEGPITLLYSAKNQQQNQAVVLRDYLLARGG